MAEYKRILLKFSGEARDGQNKTGFDEATCLGVARQVKKLTDAGIEVGIVTGGGISGVGVQVKILTVQKLTR